MKQSSKQWSKQILRKQSLKHAIVQVKAVYCFWVFILFKNFKNGIGIGMAVQFRNFMAPNTPLTTSVFAGASPCWPNHSKYMYSSVSLSVYVRMVGDSRTAGDSGDSGDSSTLETLRLWRLRLWRLYLKTTTCTCSVFTLYSHYYSFTNIT